MESWVCVGMAHSRYCQWLCYGSGVVCCSSTFTLSAYAVTDRLFITCK
jgi:hypothetical protein